MKTEARLTEATGQGKSGKSTVSTSLPSGLDPAILNDMNVSITAELGTGSLTVQELLQLKSGSTVSLQTTLTTPIELKIHGRVIARGEIVAVGDHFGVKVTEILAQNVS